MSSRIRSTRCVARAGRLAAASLLLVLASSCSALRPSEAPPLASYSIDSAPAQRTPRVPPSASATAPTLIVNPPRAATGFDRQHIIYIREPHRLEHFAHSGWVEPDNQP